MRVQCGNPGPGRDQVQADGMLVNRLHRLIKLPERGGRGTQHCDGKVPEGLGDLVAQDKEGLLLLAAARTRSPCPTK